MWQHVISTCKNEEMSQSLTYFAIYIYQIVYVLQKKKYIYIYIYIVAQLNLLCYQQTLLSVSNSLNSPFIKFFFKKKIVF